MPRVAATAPTQPASVSSRHAGSPTVLAVLRGGRNVPRAVTVRQDAWDEARMELQASRRERLEAAALLVGYARAALRALAVPSVGAAAMWLVLLEAAVQTEQDRARAALLRDDDPACADCADARHRIGHGAAA